MGIAGEERAGLFAPELEAFVLVGEALDWKVVALLQINTFKKKKKIYSMV